MFNTRQGMKSLIDAIIYITMFTALYINWTDFPVIRHIHEVRGPLIKIGTEQ